MKRKGILIVISGFSGAGKGTLVKQLMKTYDNYALSISMTTRAPRVGESDGVEYFFSTRENFEKKIAEDGLIEYAEYCGNYYGTPKSYVEQQLLAGKDVILEIEIQGALKVKEKLPQTLLLFVTPPNATVLKERLVGRGTETMEVIEQRMNRAVEESQGIEAYDYLVINDDLQTCTEEIHQIVQSAKSASVRNTEFIDQIRRELEQLSKGDK
ncbi:MAG: guanylate kinase [Lachnospiraceae bacterium]|nr:guanylate kinase [Lachnospiraceae bacterium]